MGNPYVKPYVKDPSGGFDVPYTPFEEYQEQFRDIFDIKRENGIIEIRMHSDHKEAKWHHGMHKGWSQILYLVGQDPENEVAIIGGTGDYFIKGVNNEEQMAWAKKQIEEGHADVLKRQQAEFPYNTEWTDGRALMHAVVDYLPFPTIGVYNGPSVGLSCIATFCDLTLCSDQATFFEAHFKTNMCPGDGHLLSFQTLAGPKRAAYLAYTGDEIDAQTAKEWGMVNEVLPNDQLYPRAWELARKIRKQSRYTTRWTHDLVAKPYREAVLKDIDNHFALEIASQQTVSALGGDYNEGMDKNMKYKD